MTMPPTCAYFEQNLSYYKNSAAISATLAASIAEFELDFESELAKRRGEKLKVEAEQRKVAAARQRNDRKLPSIDVGAKASLEESIRLAGIGGKRKRKRN